MITAIHIIKFIIKILLFIILLPFFMTWIYVRYRLFRYVLMQELINAGISKDYAKRLADEMQLKKFIKS